MAGQIYRALNRNQNVLAQLAGLAGTVLKPMQQQATYRSLLDILGSEEPVMGTQVSTTRPEGSIGPEGVMAAVGDEPRQNAPMASREVQPNPATLTPVQTGTRTRVRSMGELGNEDIMRLGAAMSAGPGNILDMLANAEAARRPKVQVVNQEGGGLDVLRIHPSGKVDSERIQQPQFRPPTASFTTVTKRDPSGKVMTEKVGDKMFEIEEEIDRTSNRPTGRTSLGKEVSGSDGGDKTATRQREQKLSALETKKRGLEAKIMARYAEQIKTGAVNMDKILSNEQRIPQIQKYDSYGDPLDIKEDDKEVLEWIKTARELESHLEQQKIPFERRVGQNRQPKTPGNARPVLQY